jgi:hypothetical protein
MTIRTYRGDAPAVSKVISIPRPQNYQAGVINIKINNKTISHFEWDADALASAWNNSDYPEVQSITATVSSGEEEQYGASEALILTADIPGEDFFVTVLIGESVLTNEIQTLTFFPTPDGGTFTLTFDGQTTGAITFVDGDPSTTAANILAGLIALSNIGASDVEVEILGTYSYQVHFVGAFESTDVPAMTVNYTSLTGGDVAVSISTSQEGVLPTNEVQTISLPTAPTGGDFTLTYDGQTTAAIAWDAIAATVQTRLEALSNIAPGDVVVTGGPFPGTPVVVEFDGTLAGQNVELITGNGAGLTGTTGNITGVATTRGGSTPTNEKQRYYYQASPVGKSAYWKSNPTTTFAYNASNAVIKAALVGSTVTIPLAANYSHIRSTEYVILSGDINVTGDLTVSGSGGGVIIELTGNLAGLTFVDIPDIDLLSTTGPVTGASQEIAQSTHTAAVQRYEIQTFTITDTTLPGTFTLTVYDSGGSPHTTDPIAYLTDGYAVADAINAALGGTYVGCSSSSTGTDLVVVVQYLNLGYQDTNITQLTANEGSVQVEETTAGNPGTPEIQLISAAGTEAIRAGTYTLTYSGQTTGSLVYNANAATIQAALIALSNIGPTEVVVSGGPISDSFSVQFLASLGNVAEITATSSLVNSQAEVEDYVTGGLAIYAEEITRNRGPECFDDELNYDPPGVPSDADEIQFEFGQNNCKWGIKQRDTFTVLDVSDNTLQLDTGRWLFQDGQRVRVYSTTTTPAGLTGNNPYYVINSDGRGRFQLSSTLGGSAINITDAGTGVHTIALHLAKIEKPARYSYEIGLQRNNSGFEEYRPRYLEVDCDEVILGEGDGSDSPLTRFNLGTKASAITVYGTGSGAEPDTPAACFLIEESSSDVLCYGGEVGFACWLDETSEVQDIKAYSTSLKSIGGLTCRDITVDQGSSLRGKLIPSGTVKVGV